MNRSGVFVTPGTILLLTLISLPAAPARAGTDADVGVFGRFAGTSPCRDALRELLDVPEDAVDELQWELTLRQDPAGRTPTDYRLRCTYFRRLAGGAESARSAATVEREGSWKITRGTKANLDAVVYDLSGTISLCEIDRNIAHLLNPDRSLMVGNGGRSFSLNRTGASEKRVTPSAAFLSKPSQSYKLAPLATGPEVFGVFEGRTPAQGIARELKAKAHPEAIKAKWRVTLYHDSKTQIPTRYRVEGTLHHNETTREGNWKVTQGTATDPDAVVYELEPANGERRILLLKGDDNVLFFLDQERRPLTGHADFSYTLNRRVSEVAPGL